MGVPTARPHLGWFSTAKFHSGVSIVPSSHLLSKQMMWHARSAWWLETKSYARILRASSAPCGRGSKNQKFPFIFLSAPPPPPAENLRKEGKFLVLYRDRRERTRRAISPFVVQNRFEQSRVIQHKNERSEYFGCGKWGQSRLFFQICVMLLKS